MKNTATSYMKQSRPNIHSLRGVQDVKRLFTLCTLSDTMIPYWAMIRYVHTQCSRRKDRNCRRWISLIL